MINGEAADRIYFITKRFDLKGAFLCKCPFNVFVGGKNTLLQVISKNITKTLTAVKNYY